MELQANEKAHKRTNKDMDHRPPQMYELRSPTQPALRQQPGTAKQSWHKQPHNTTNTTETYISRTK
eukprot:4346408-Amphidinium_carterae.1